MASPQVLVMIKSKSENNLKLTTYAKTENKEFFPKVNPDINDSETAKNNYILISQLKSKRNKMAIKSVFNNEQENSTKLNVLLREKNILTKTPVRNRNANRMTIIIQVGEYLIS